MPRLSPPMIDMTDMRYSVVWRMGVKIWIALGLLWSFVTTPILAYADTAHIAVATNFYDVAQVLQTDFEARTDHELTLISGSTGKLYAQILHGAPFDVFLAADQVRPQKLEASGHALPGTRLTYAVGELVLWSADTQLSVEDAPHVLKAGRFRKLAIAQPELAPYGYAAQEVLQALGVADKLHEKIVMGENIGQTYALVHTRNAELGLIARSYIRKAQSKTSLAHAASYGTIPQALYTPIRQDGIGLMRAQNNPAAHAFLQYLSSPAAQTLIAQSGYKDMREWE